MNGVRLSVPGSPRAWQWQIDEEAEKHCIAVLLDDAIDGSIYESGWPEVRFVVINCTVHFTNIGCHVTRLASCRAGSTTYVRD